MNEVLKLLESYVGKPSELGGKKDFLEKEWTPEQEKDFIVKMTDLLRNNKKVFKEMTSFPNNERNRKRVVGEFVLYFGPKTIY